MPGNCYLCGRKDVYMTCHNCGAIICGPIGTDPNTQNPCGERSKGTNDKCICALCRAAATKSNAASLYSSITALKDITKALRGGQTLFINGSNFLQVKQKAKELSLLLNDLDKEDKISKFYNYLEKKRMGKVLPSEILLVVLDIMLRPSDSGDAEGIEVSRLGSPVEV